MCRTHNRLDAFPLLKFELDREGGGDMTLGARAWPLPIQTTPEIGYEARIAVLDQEAEAIPCGGLYRGMGDLYLSDGRGMAYKTRLDPPKESEGEP